MIAYKKHKGLSAQGIELLKNPYIYEKLLTIESGVGVTPEEYLIRFEEVLSASPENILDFLRLYPGFDGKICTASPRIVSNGTDTFFYHMIFLGGSDVCVGHEIIKTTDGKDFTEPKKLLGLEDEYK